MAETPQYLHGNYPSPLIDPDALPTDEAARTALFEAACRKVQSIGNGLAGSCPYVDLAVLKARGQAPFLGTPTPAP